MTATTAQRAYPYPEGTDFLGDTAAAIEALADAVDVDVFGLDVRVDAIEAATTPWANAVLVNSWVAAYAATYGTPGYRKVGGVVFLRGLVDGGTSGSTVLTLPAGFRPAAAIILPLVTGSGSGVNSLCRCDVNPNGTVNVQGTADDYVSLAGISFPADA